MTPLYIFIIIAFGVIPTMLVAYWGWGAYTAHAEANSYSVKKEDNNDEKAIRDAIRLVEKSRNSLFMYDDGDNIAQSIYAHDGFISALKDKLNANSAYKLQVFFACEEKTGIKFAAHFAKHIGEGRVEIYFSKDAGGSQHRLHYKVADDGDIMYFSEHEQGASERKTSLLEKNYDLKNSKFKTLAETCKSKFQEMCRSGKRYAPPAGDAHSA